ncbi:hypothetical protein CYY_007146 [Polysphondylium violaceum]|uniref:Vesicle transport protein USE1 n=1 Tax=Polysphondylium violaceum TaxID=133409 RepID=A0A8J4PP33_9MYCE|nr:hypothetical protein CYY_007146 [Polysphondylium violaceum]
MTDEESIQKIETNLKRLIHSCEKTIASDNNNDDETKRSIEKYIPFMLSQLKKLNELTQTTKKKININASNNNSNNDNNDDYYGGKEKESKYYPTKETLTEYSRKIEVIVGLINKEKMTSPISNRPSIIRLQSSELSHAKKMDEIHTVLKQKNKEEKKKIESLLPTSSNNSSNQQQQQQQQRIYSENKSSPLIKFRNTFQPNNNELVNLLGSKYIGSQDGNSSSGGGDGNTPLGDRELQEQTDKQRQMQESVTNELLEIAKELKNNSTQMNSKLSQEGYKLDELSSLMVHNRSKLDTQRERLKDHISKSSKDTLNYCFIMVIVLVVLISTYLFIIKLASK